MYISSTSRRPLSVFRYKPIARSDHHSAWQWKYNSLDGSAFSACQVRSSCDLSGSHTPSQLLASGWKSSWCVPRGWFSTKRAFLKLFTRSEYPLTALWRLWVELTGVWARNLLATGKCVYLLLWTASMNVYTFSKEMIIFICEMIMFLIWYSSTMDELFYLLYIWNLPWKIEE